MSNIGIVLISDIHFSLNTLKEATASLKHAVSTATSLGYYLVIAGDLNDSKAIIRAEVANALIDIFATATCPIYILVGNHDKINEKGLDHSLNFLMPYVTIVHKNTKLPDGTHLISYHTDLNAFREVLNTIPKGSTIIMHQGVRGAFMGDYIQDKTSIDPEELQDYKVYSGHYHRHQKIWSITYIGNPYTLTFGEANDPAKGYLVIDPHGRVKKIPLDTLRKHIIIERNEADFTIAQHGVKPHDLVWLKIKGPSDWLKTLNKDDLGHIFIGHSNFKLDLIPTEAKKPVHKVDSMTSDEILDSVIDSSAFSGEHKKKMKQLWRKLMYAH